MASSFLMGFLPAYERSYAGASDLYMQRQRDNAQRIRDARAFQERLEILRNEQAFERERERARHADAVALSVLGFGHQRSLQQDRIDAEREAQSRGFAHELTLNSSDWANRREANSADWFHRYAISELDRQSQAAAAREDRQWRGSQASIDRGIALATNAAQAAWRAAQVEAQARRDAADRRDREARADRTYKAVLNSSGDKDLASIAREEVLGDRGAPPSIVGGMASAAGFGRGNPQGGAVTPPLDRTSQLGILNSLASLLEKRLSSLESISVARFYSMTPEQQAEINREIVETKRRLSDTLNQMSLLQAGTVRYDSLEEQRRGARGISGAPRVPSQDGPSLNRQSPPQSNPLSNPLMSLTDEELMRLGGSISIPGGR